jgi:hypothetical protein
MSRLTAYILAVVACSLSWSLRATAQSVTLRWDASPAADVTEYRVYRSACADDVVDGICTPEGTFGRIATVAAPTTTYTDEGSGLSLGKGFVWYVTAVCPATGASCSGESGESNRVAHFFAAPPPPAPGNLEIVSVEANLDPPRPTVAARWRTSPGSATRWTLVSHRGQVGAGQSATPNGFTSMLWEGQGRHHDLRLEVCLLEASAAAGDSPGFCRTWSME